ncbi:EF-hand domain pair protein [Raphanus sativus]|nr:EF-hand domain pair protein [Raphanus sativus]
MILTSAHVADHSYMQVRKHGFITKEKLKKVMKSMGRNPKAEWEMMIFIYVDGNGDIYIIAQNTSQSEDNQPPSLLQMDTQNIDRFSVSEISTSTGASGGVDDERSSGEERVRSRIVESE